jgi:hypothetical protein
MSYPIGKMHHVDLADAQHLLIPFTCPSLGRNSFMTMASGMLRLWHCQSSTLTTPQDLIHRTTVDLIRYPVCT